MISAINATIGIATIISHVIFVVLVILIAIYPQFRAKVYRFVHIHILNIILVEALAALLGSLAYSNIVGFPPCDLCWIQRVFIYPQVVIALVAIWKKDKMIVDYLLPMSVIGGLVALYQSFIQWGINPVPLGGCVASGAECAKIYVNLFGYITIPFMSFTVFAFSIGVMMIYYQARKIHG